MYIYIESSSIPLLYIDACSIIISDFRSLCSLLYLYCERERERSLGVRRVDSIHGQESKGEYTEEDKGGQELP